MENVVMGERVTASITGRHEIVSVQGTVVGQSRQWGKPVYLVALDGDAENGIPAGERHWCYASQMQQLEASIA